MARVETAVGAGFLVAAALAGCAQTSEYEGSLAFEAGYSDGCRTATARARPFSSDVFLNEEAFEEDAAYRAGWNTGSNTCGTAAGRTDRGIPSKNDALGPSRF